MDKDIAPGFGQRCKLYELVTTPGNLVAGDLLEVRFRKIEDAVNAGVSSGFGGRIGIYPVVLRRCKGKCQDFEFKWLLGNCWISNWRMVHDLVPSFVGLAWKEGGGREQIWEVQLSLHD